MVQFPTTFEHALVHSNVFRTRLVSISINSAGFVHAAEGGGGGGRSIVDFSVTKNYLPVSFLNC